jgi:hypothetical protein
VAYRNGGGQTLDSRGEARNGGDAAKSSVSALAHGTALLESSDDYHRVVVMLDAKTRVIAADIQWIIQERKRSGRGAWEGKYYCRSKAGLLLYTPKPTAPELLALPDWFPEHSPPPHEGG